MSKCKELRNLVVSCTQPGMSPKEINNWLYNKYSKYFLEILLQGIKIHPLMITDQEAVGHPIPSLLGPFTLKF